MKSFINLSLLAPAILAAAPACAVENPTVQASSLEVPSVQATQVREAVPAPPAVFKPAAVPFDNIDPVAAVKPHLNFTIPYDSNSSATTIDIKNIMKVPTVLLETIASIVNVDCSATSVQLTFNDSAIFETTVAAWKAQDDFLMVTNHLGDCDAELERGFFLVDRVEFDNSTLVCTAHSHKTDLAATAKLTEITFGQIPASEIAARDIVIDPSLTLITGFDLPTDTVIFEYAPYASIYADQASFDANVTFSGFMQYNWLTMQLNQLYFDIDAAMAADVILSADVTAAYSTEFRYEPASLFYGVTVPGILELGPQLNFGVVGELSASGAVNVSTDFYVSLSDGKVHLDFLDNTKTTSTGWVPNYNVTADISAQTVAQINPKAELTVQLAINFFGGLLDLSSGVTAKPGFENTFTVTGGAAVDLGGLKNTTGDATTCSQGLKLDSDFVFAVDVFATSFWEKEVYNISIPLYDACFAWA
ncbi:hypothetical protein HYFRA_00007576 [Hymenoscyphus fraxineus]|uniref:Isoamyl alcohol n=1 Tax=Hymenoscyphus fraxineus TaxID=746836 RepID=A0A9N9KVP2_9HELO|nr:hypothetical protein HYFRA_00007576 [Hymenoscyphus fraxineus]